MRKEHRLQIFRIYLETITSEGVDTNFVIFTDPKSEKFVQFSGAPSDPLLVVDIPLVQVNETETAILLDLFGESRRSSSEESEYAYQAEILLYDSIELAEKIFLDVFQLPYDFSIEVVLNLEEQSSR